MKTEGLIRIATLGLAILLFSPGCEDDHSSHDPASTEDSENDPPPSRTDDQVTQSRELVTYTGYWMPPDSIVHNGTNYNISNTFEHMIEVIDLNNTTEGAISIVMNVESVPPTNYFYITELGPTVWSSDTFTLIGKLFVATESSPNIEYDYTIQFADESSGMLRIPALSGGLSLGITKE